MPDCSLPWTDRRPAAMRQNRRAFLQALGTMVVASSCSPSISTAYSGELGRRCPNGAHPVLDRVFDAAQPTGIVTWGLSDKDPWVPVYYKRQDGLPNRPLPLDRDMQVKPMYSVVSEFITRCGA